MANNLLTSIIVILLVNISSISTYGKVTKETVDSAAFFYLGGEYDKCIDLVKKHEDYYVFNKNTSRLKAYGALSINAKVHMFQDVDEEDYIRKIEWATWACEFFNATNKYFFKYKIRSEESLNEFLGDLQILRSCCGVIYDDIGKRANNYIKMSIKWTKKTHDEFFKIRDQWTDYPNIKLAILSNTITYFRVKNNGFHKLPSNILDEYWEAVDNLVSLTDQLNEPEYTLIANGYVSDLYNMFVTDIHSKKPDYCKTLDVMLKSRDFMLYSKGASHYRDFKSTSWESIKNQLEDGEYCMEHFESHIKPGMLYPTWIKTSKRRNFAFVFNNKMTKPDIWHRGYIDNIEKQGFNGVTNDYSDCSIVYVTCTDYMALKDIVGNNSMIHRCHSLSHIKQAADNLNNSTTFSFIGCINFNKTEDNKTIEAKQYKGLARSRRFENFPTDESLLIQLNNLKLENFNPLLRSEVNRDNFFITMRNCRFVHISTHGIVDNLNISEMNNDLDVDVVNGSNILKNCKLLLSGYNDDNSQYISGDEIRSMNLSHISLLFLDACKTGDGRKIALGSYSLAEAFHLAGVRNIIATLDSVDAVVSHDFSIKFYDLLKQGKNIHDAFYIAKKIICPNERIILWE